MIKVNGQRKRIGDLSRFYTLLDQLGQKTCAPRLLANCAGHDNWPTRGIYFFQEPGEQRADSGTGNRIARQVSCAIRITLAGAAGYDDRHWH